MFWILSASHNVFTQILCFTFFNIAFIKVIALCNKVNKEEEAQTLKLQQAYWRNKSVLKLIMAWAWDEWNYSFIGKQLCFVCKVMGKIFKWENIFRNKHIIWKNMDGYSNEKYIKFALILVIDLKQNEGVLEYIN